MRSPSSFIVKAVGGKRYDNTRKIGGIDFIISTSDEDHKYSNRYAEVVETPIADSFGVEQGDILLVHHNVFKFYNDMKGVQRSGKSFFKDDLFFIDPDQFFAYKHNDQWYAHDRYCFVKPVMMKDSGLSSSKMEESLIGEITIPNKYLISNGICTGDKVCFKPDAKYEFEVDGQKMYRLYDHQVTIVL